MMARKGGVEETCEKACGSKDDKLKRLGAVRGVLERAAAGLGRCLRRALAARANLSVESNICLAAEKHVASRILYSYPRWWAESKRGPHLLLSGNESVA